VAAAKREEDEKKRPEVRRLPSTQADRGGRARRGDSSRAPTQGLAGPFVISHFSDSDNVLKRNGQFFNFNLFSKLFLKITPQKHYLQI
jgi:hypothetical protein